MLILSVTLMYPIVKNPSNVCKNYLAMEKENKHLSAALADVHLKRLFFV
jgi:hypothetical protein